MDNRLIFRSCFLFVITWGVTMYGKSGLAVKSPDLSEVVRRDRKIRSSVIKRCANKTPVQIGESDRVHVSEKRVARRIKNIRTKTDTGGWVE